MGTPALELSLKPITLSGRAPAAARATNHALELRMMPHRPSTDVPVGWFRDAIALAWDQVIVLTQRFA
jgi:hypothetical protein